MMDYIRVFYTHSITDLEERLNDSVRMGHRIISVYAAEGKHVAVIRTA